MIATKNLRNQSLTMARAYRIGAFTFITTNRQQDCINSALLYVVTMFAPVTALLLGA